MAQRRYFDLNADNVHECNLTELLASESQDRGYVTHNDFSFGHTNRYAYVWKQLTGPLKETKSLLDVGAGKLQLCHFLWRNRCKPVPEFQYWGLELRAKMNWMPAENAHWQVPINMIAMDILENDPATCADAHLVSIWPNQFDVVVSFETFEHVPRTHGRTFMEKLFKWTKPGGTCLFSTPNAGVSSSTADNHIDKTTGESREWGYQEKLDLARSVGFNVVDTFGTFCGTTRLPDEVQEKLKNDPDWAKIKKFISHALLTCVISVPYPEHSNNALFHLERPA